MFARLKLQWVDGVRYWHKLWSLRFAVASVSFGAVSSSLPLWQPALPPLPFAIASTLCAAVAGFSTLIKQPALQAKINGDSK